MADRALPPVRFQTFEEIAKRYPALDPQVMHAWVTMRQAQTRIELALELHLGRSDLSLGRFLVLVHLIRAEGHSLAPAQLAEFCGITRASITGLVDTLEKDKHVVREVDPDDRRSVQVRLTVAGRRLIEHMLPDHFARIMKTMSGLTRAELKTLQRLSEKVSAGAAALELP